MASEERCRNCGESIYQGLDFALRRCWFHTASKSYVCDLPYTMTAQPLPDDVTPMRKDWPMASSMGPWHFLRSRAGDIVGVWRRWTATGNQHFGPVVHHERED